MNDPNVSMVPSRPARRIVRGHFVVRRGQRTGACRCSLAVATPESEEPRGTTRGTPGAVTTSATRFAYIECIRRGTLGGTRPREWAARVPAPSHVFLRPPHRLYDIAPFGFQGVERFRRAVLSSEGSAGGLEGEKKGSWSSRAGFTMEESVSRLAAVIVFTEPR